MPQPELSVVGPPSSKAKPRRPSPSRERFERLYRTIRDRICLFDYPPGGRLAEEELAQEFSISRTPVRRVLARLEADGLIEARHGVGHFVTSLQLDEVTQLYQLRMELAVLMGRLAPIPRSPEDLDRIRALIARCDALSKEPEYKAFSRLNMDFFSEISAMTGNAPLREISERLYFLTSRIWLEMMPRLDLAEEFAYFRREMEEVLAAAEIGDLETVGHIRRTHISMSYARMMRYAKPTHG
ncbi:MAG TPA: GntR family transcriptional regulator [Alphaproteobacteria bacterium]|nr:GntR family transcriptional regulator [Alphaproteobacteria bacterium]